MVNLCHVSQITVNRITQEHKFDNCHLVVLIDNQSQIILRSNVLRHYFYFPEVIIQVQNDHGVFDRLVPCI